MHIKSQKDFFSGLMFVVAGVAFAWDATTYNLGDSGELLAVNGTRCISGHGEINVPATWWLSYLLATASPRTL